MIPQSSEALNKVEIVDSEEHGSCSDDIRVRPSSCISQASLTQSLHLLSRVSTSEKSGHTRLRVVPCCNQVGVKLRS
jgi:hypothetical protein